MDWAENLVYAGYDDWRLATISTAATDSAYDCSSGTEQACIVSGNELGYMFHYNIPGSFPKSGDQTVGDVTLTGIGSSYYWSGTKYASSSSIAWLFSLFGGVPGSEVKGSQEHGWAVRPGQIAAAPLPGTAVLMALGLGAIAGSRRTRRRLW